MLLPGVGGSIGGSIGSGLGWAFNKITGIGDYKVNANSLLRPMSVPSFGENCIRIRHKEYIGDYTSTTSYSNLTFPINPGQPTTFPWLSTIAANYQEWCANGLIFYFVSTSAAALNSTNTALGKVVMATSYDVLDPSFSTTSQMLATEFSNYGKPAEDLMHAVECDPKLRPTLLLYTRVTSPPTGADQRLYDLGTFTLASDGMQAASNIGGLWVSYDITLCKPIIAPATTTKDMFFMSASNTTSISASTTAVSNSSTRPIGGTLVANTYTFPKSLSTGTYTIAARSFGDGITSLTYQTAVSSYSAAITAVNYFDNGTLSAFTTPTAATTGSFETANAFQINSQNASITLRAIITTTGVSPVELTITRVA